MGGYVFVYFVEKSNPNFPLLENLSKTYRENILHAFSVSGNIDGIIISKKNLLHKDLIFYSEMKFIKNYGKYNDKDFLFCLTSKNRLNNISDIEKILKDNSEFFEIYCNNKTFIVFSPRNRESLNKISENIYKILGEHRIYAVFRDFALK